MFFGWVVSMCLHYNGLIGVGMILLGDSFCIALLFPIKQGCGKDPGVPAES